MSDGILDLLDSANYQTYNRAVARALGSVNAAIMLSELVNRYQYHRSEGKLIEFKKYEGQWFYYTVEKCHDRTILSKKEQATAIGILEKKGLCTKAQIGMPAKRHFKLHITKIVEFITDSKNRQEVPKRSNKELPKGPTGSDQRGQPIKNPIKNPNKKQQQGAAGAAAFDLRSHEEEANSEALPNGEREQSKDSNIESPSSAATPPVPPPPPWVVREIGQQDAENLAKVAADAKYDLEPMESRFMDQKAKGFTTGPVAWLLTAVRGSWQPKVLRPHDRPVTPRLNADTDYIFDVYDLALQQSRAKRPHLDRIIKNFIRNRRQGIIQIYRDCDVADTPLAFALDNPEELAAAKELLRTELPKLQSGK